MRRLVAAVAVVGLVAVTGACSSASDPEGADDTTGSTQAETGELGTDVILDAGPPQPGGSLTMALEAETDGWDPTVNRWAASGTMVGLAIYDPLTAIDAEGIAQPYLAETLEHDDDYLTWTITLRPDVTFHDGSPLTSADVVATLEGHLASALTRPTFAPLETVEAIDDLTVQANMSSPWVMFPQVLAAQAGVIPSAATIGSAEGARDPVGSGPFDLVSWVPGDRLDTQRNDAYWRTDEDGNPLPYLDALTFEAIEEGPTRINALLQGEVDVLHTSSSSQIVQLEEEAEAGNIQLRNDRSNSEKGFVMLNLLQPPFDDPEVRTLLVQATDVETYIQVVGDGAVDSASSVFPPASPFHSEEADEIWPAYDPDAARSGVEAWEAENGPLAFVLKAPATALGREQAQFLQSQWEAVGMDVQIESQEQTSYILDAVAGQFEAILWRQFGASDPDSETHWWVSENANDIGVTSLNFARIRDDEVDRLLAEGRENDDPEIRQQAYQDLAVRFNELIPYVWIAQTRWVVAAGNRVHDFWNVTLPDGEDATPISSGVFRFTQTWVDQ